MYQREKSNWQKHMDFFVCDVLCLQLAYLIAYVIRHGWNLAYWDSRYRNMGVLMALLEISICFLIENHDGILYRGILVELKKVIILVSAVIMCIFTYFFVTKTSWIFSRAVFIQVWIIGVFLTFVARILRKRVVQKKFLVLKNLRSMIIISTEDSVDEILRVFQQKEYKEFYISGLVIIGENCKIKAVQGVSVVANEKNVLDYLRECIVDEVFVNLPKEDCMTRELTSACEEMGITVHFNLGYTNCEMSNTIVEKIAGYTVLTSSIKFAEARQLFVKRIMDIAGGIIGCILTGVLFVALGPVIYSQSPGPVFFSQMRVGRNGRVFRIYKFRSMYVDAEERKKELFTENKMKGFMFKMEDDPRITPVGRFIRKTSLDEFPQFWNVLKGEMSLVGTRPPTMDEYERYENHHKVRLAAKPGLTGLWQVSGRSDIVNFEEVVSLDKKYITEWNIGLDIKILYKTIWIVLKGEGSI